MPFEGAEDIKDADRRVADLLKEMFSQHLPRVEIEEQEPLKDEQSDDGQDLYTGQEGPQESKKRRLKRESDVKAEQAAKESSPVASKPEEPAASQSSEDDIF